METATQTINIMLVDDHALVRKGIKSLLEDEDDLLVVAEASSGVETINLLQEQQPNLIIIDIKMPRMTGIELVKKLVEKGINIFHLAKCLLKSE